MASTIGTASAIQSSAPSACFHSYKSPAQIRTLGSQFDFVLLDFLNLARYFSRQEPRVEVPLTLAHWLYVNKGKDFFCLADACTYRELGYRQGSRAQEIFNKLCGVHHKHFGQAPAYREADQYLLAEASLRNAAVISNDTYCDYRHIHPWLEDKDRCIPIMIVRENIHIAGEVIPLITDLEKAAAAVFGMLKA